MHRHQSTTAYYPGAHRFLPINDTARTDFAEEFAEIPVLANIQHARVTPMTSEKALEQVALDVPECDKSWKSRPSFNKFDPFFDFVRKCVPDPAHALHHFIIDMFRVLSGDLEPNINKKRKRTGEGDDLVNWEQELRKEFPRVLRKASNLEKIDSLIAEKLRVPSEWHRLVPCFGTDPRVKTGSIRIVERLSMISDVGKYIVGLTDTSITLRRRFVKALTALQSLLRLTTWSKEDAKNSEEEIARALADLERILPYKWNTISRHVLLHLPAIFFLHGSFWTANMLTEEKFHQFIRKFVKTSTCNIASAMGKNYSRFQKLHLQWGLNDNAKLSSHLCRQDMKYSDQDVRPGRVANRGASVQMPVGIFECISESWNQYVQGKIDEQAQRREAMDADALQEPTILQLRPEEIVNEAVEYKDIRLDSQLFIGRNHSKLHAKHDNSCFVSDFIDERGQQSLAYGILKTIYAHTIRGETRYFFFPTWYVKATGETTKRNPITGIQRIKPAHEGWKWYVEVINNVYPVSCVFWPSDPFRDSSNTTLRTYFDVIVQRNPVYEF